MSERESGHGAQRCRCQCHWDLSWLRFGDTRIAVSDVDGLFVVERYGKFLFLETKTSDEPVPVGQAILLRALSRLRGCTVILLRGARGDPETIQPIIRGEFGPRKPTSRTDMQARVDRWFTAVTGGVTEKGKA